ncbi:MAG: hypothetical protein U0V74_01300 [Chitinophagales bacterium]
MIKEKIKALQIIHIALTLGSLVYIFITTAVAFKPLHTTPVDEEQIFVGVAVVFALSISVISKFIFSKVVDKAKAETTIEKKLDSYRTAFIIKVAMLEASTLFSCTITLITGCYLTIGLAFMTWLILALQRPTEMSIADDLGISPSEENRTF